MTYSWPVGSVVPARQTFFAGGQAVDGGRTSGGVPMISPEAGGGWGTLDYEFSAFGGAISPRLVSWLLSGVRNGRVFELPVVRGPQLVPASDFGATEAQELAGAPWNNEQPWLGDNNWAFSPVAPVAADGLKGSTTLVINMSVYGQILWHGHVIGEGQHAYLVDDIQYAGSVATVTVMPPLRRDVDTNSLVRFRPLMTGICTSPDSFEALFEPGGIIRPGSISFVEVIA